MTQAKAANADNSTIEARLRKVEDMLEIYNLIGMHPPFVDSAAGIPRQDLWADDAVFSAPGREHGVSAVEMEEGMKGLEYEAALRDGLAHFSSHPYVRVDGDTAVALSYVQLLTLQPNGEPVTIPFIGSSTGVFMHRVAASRWDLVRTSSGWRVQHRVASTFNGAEATKALLVSAFDRP